MNLKTYLFSLLTSAESAYDVLTKKVDIDEVLYHIKAIKLDLVNAEKAAKQYKIW
jgi:hypothetical protein